MAQYDILLTQNVHATLTEYSEKFVNVARGGLISADTNQDPVVLPVGTNDYVLVADSTEVSGLRWADLSTLGVSVSNQGDDRIVTATATADDLNAEANLTYNNSQGLYIGSGLGIVFANATTTYQIYTANGANKASIDILTGTNSAGGAGDISIKAGTGTAAGGNVYFQRDTTYGNFYFGSGAASHLPEAATGTHGVMLASSVGLVSESSDLHWDVATVTLTLDDPSAQLTVGSSDNVHLYNGRIGWEATLSFFRWVQVGTVLRLDFSTTSNYSSFSSPFYVDGTNAYVRTQWDFVIDSGDTLYLDGVSGDSRIWDATGDLTFRDASNTGGVTLSSLVSGIGEGVSFGNDNEVPYTNNTTDDFDYSSNFRFDGTAFTAGSDITLVSSIGGHGFTMRNTSGVITTLHSLATASSGQTLSWAGGDSSSTTATHHGGSATFKGGDQTGTGGGNGGAVYIYGGSSVSGSAGSVYLGDGAAGALTENASATHIVAYNTTTGLLNWISVNDVQVSYGTDNQIPVTNAAGDGFEYSSRFYCDVPNNRLVSPQYLWLDDGSGNRLNIYGGTAPEIQPNTGSTAWGIFGGDFNSASGGNAGALTLNGGGKAGVGAGNGGAIYLRGGASSNGNGGAVYIYGGAGTGGSDGITYLGTGSGVTITEDSSPSYTVTIDITTGRLYYSAVGDVGGGEWTADTNGITYSAGNVGVGGASQADATFYVVPNDTNHAAKINANAARGASRYALYIDDGDTNSRGSVRIETTTGVSLSVDSVASETQFDMSNNSDGFRVRTFVRDSDDNFGFYDVTNTFTFLRYVSNVTASSRTMTVMTSGSFGIGATPDTSYKLDVTGNTHIDGQLYIQNPSTPIILEEDGTSYLRLVHDASTLRFDFSTSGGSSFTTYVTPITAVSEGAVTIRYNNSNRIVTTSSGTTFSANTFQGDSISSYYGTGNDGRIWHDGVSFNFRSQLHGAPVYLQGEDAGGTNRTMISFDPDSSVSLRYNGTEVFRTTDVGISVGPSTGTGGTNAIDMDTSAAGSYSGQGIIGDDLGYTGIKFYDGTNGNMTIFNKRNHTTYGKIYFATGATPTVRMYVDNEGDVGIGATTSVTSGYRLELFSTDNKGRAADWTATSDVRLKTNIQPFGDVLGGIMDLHGSQYGLSLYNRRILDDKNKPTDEWNDELEVGFIAQDMLEIFPHVVHGSDEEFFDISYMRVGAIALAGVAELKDEKDREIDALNTRIEALEEDNEKLKKLMYGNDYN